MRKLWVFTVAIFAAMVGVSSASAQAPTPTRQPYFKPKRALLLSATKPQNKSRFPASELAATALQSLRNQFSAPQYRSVTESEMKAALRTAAEGRVASNATVSPENPIWLAERSPAETTAALIAAGKAADADTAVFVVVREASKQQVTLVLWNVETRTGKATVEGKTLTRSAEYYTRTQRMGWDTYAPTDGRRDDASTMNTNPERDGHVGSVSVSQPDLDNSMKKILISRMLTEWYASLYK
ncbi:MAG: hypothetical protein H8F28_20170 [Fibrella sp.]|nr:hypothetical protein [Armatimonadota bacterium]